MRRPTCREMTGYPWQETVECRRCKRLYGVDYRQERDWSYCTDCTGETGKPCRNYDELQRLKAEEGLA